MQTQFTRAAALAGLCLGLAAHAQSTVPPLSGVLSLSSSATLEVPQDWLTVAFSATREGSDAQSVQTALKRSLETALGEARKVAKPGQVDVQTGSFSLHPRYTSPVRGAPPVISGWQGTAELIVQGQDVAAIAQLTGRVQTMTIARVSYSLSREARVKVEADVTAQAIARWRAQAAHMSQQFGYSGYSVREVNVSTNDTPPPQPLQMRAMRATGVADESLPTEAGKADVTANVTGSVQMMK